MIKWTISTPRTVAEDDRNRRVVEAATLEDAIIAYENLWERVPYPGDTYDVSVRVEVLPKTKLPLGSK